MKSYSKGFTLLEIAIVAAIIGILAMITLPSIVDGIEKARVSAEKLVQTGLDEDIKRSFQEVNWQRNIAAFASEIPAAASADVTAFGPSGSTAGNGDWYVKIGRLRGVVPVISGIVTEQSQKSLYDLLYNSYGQQRLLIAGPTESGQQRYLLLSLMAAPNKGLVIPSNDGSVGWFDAVWNSEWESDGALLPGYWNSLLTVEQQNAWVKGRGTTTNVHRLSVHRIVQPKYRIQLNNTHPTYIGWLDYNGVQDQVVSAPNSGPSTSAEILSGRLIILRRGLASPGAEAYRIYLNENSSFNVSP